jgi:hypothetical protein
MAGLWKFSSLKPTSASTFLAYPFRALLPRPLCMGFFLCSLAILEASFGHFIKAYYSSIIHIVLYLTYFTVPDIVSLLDDFTTPICSYAP